ncbi:MAG: response regulator, partial [bacterium]|nr:response regulator [bacterium]
MEQLKRNQPNQSLILIVDDAPRNLQVLGNLLRGQDYKISVASNGRQALSMMKKFIPDIILLDVMMPEVDGFQVCKQLKAVIRTKDIPVIFLTGRSQSEDILKGFELGAVDYVTKPFNPAELLARVRTHLPLKKAQQENLRLA